MLTKILLLTLITFLPLVELRLSIPVGILSGSIALPFGIIVSGMGLHPLLVFAVAFVTNSLLGMILYNLLHWFDVYIHRSFMGSFYTRVLDKARRRVRPFVKKYGVLGVALFIAVPLPGSGVYTGSLGSFVLGLPKRQFYIANVIGVFIAATIVTLLTITGQSIFG